MRLFYVQISFIICFKSTETLFQMDTLTVRVGDHILLYAIWKIVWHFLGIFGRNYFEILRKFSSFHVQNFSLKSSAENIANVTFYFFHICTRFVSSLLFILWIIPFKTKLRFGRNRVSSSLIKNKLFHSNLPNSNVVLTTKFNLFQISHQKKIFMCQNFLFLNFWEI